MTRAILAFSALVLSAGAAHADHYQGHFPLQSGNSWTFKHEGDDQLSHLTVGPSWYGVSWVTGFPGAQSGLWMAWSGNTLYAWRPSTESWVPFFRFGVASGTTWDVTLDYPFWTNAKVILKVKGFDSESPLLGKTFHDCVHFHVIDGLQNGGPKEFVFTPKYGLVFSSLWVDESYDRWFLQSAVLNGKKFGLVPQQILESGNFTSYPVEGMNKLLVIKSQSQWESFYAQHKPGQEVPKADFTKQTVLVALAGQRPSNGYGVSIARVTWNFPFKSAKASAVVHLPSGIVAWVITSPYSIYLLDAKPTAVSAEWSTESDLNP